MYTGHAMIASFAKSPPERFPSTAVYQDRQTYAFDDIHPKAPVHILVIPREHIGSLAEAGRKSEHCSVTL